MLGDARLDEDRGAFRIDAAGKPIDQHLTHERTNAAGVRIIRRQRVPIGDEEVAVILFLQCLPVF